MKILLPENAYEITLGQYQDYCEIEKGDDMLIYKRKVIAVFCHLTYAMTTFLKDKEVEECYNQVMKALENINVKDQTLIIEGINFFHHQTLDQLIFAEWIDISLYYSEPKHYHKLMAVLCRPRNKKKKIQKYNGTSQYSMLMKKCPLIFFYERKFELMQFFEKMKDTYPFIYNQGNSEGSETSDFFNRWGWYSTLVDLTDTQEEGKGNILAMNKIMKFNIHEIHVFLSYRIDKQKLLERLRKIAKPI